MSSSVQAAYVRAMAKAGKVHYSDYALSQMGARKIWQDQVNKAIAEGEELEVQDLGPKKDVRVLFQQATKDVPEFYVVVATSYPVVEVVTVCRFREEVWDWTGRIMVRGKPS